jgi:hypothetical protein
VLRQVAKMLLQAWMTQKAASVWLMRQNVAWFDPTCTFGHEKGAPEGAPSTDS